MANSKPEQQVQQRLNAHNRRTLKAEDEVHRAASTLGTLAIARATAHRMAAEMRALYTAGLVDLDTYKTYYIHANAFHHWSTRKIDEQLEKLQGDTNGI